MRRALPATRSLAARTLASSKTSFSTGKTQFSSDFLLGNVTGKWILRFPGFLGLFREKSFLVSTLWPIKVGE